MIVVLAAFCALAPACMTDAGVEDGADDAFLSGKADGGVDPGSPEALGVLALVNAPTTTAGTLKAACHVTSRVDHNVITHRDGPDGVLGTADDDLFDTLAEVDAIKYIGPVTLNALVECARDHGLVTEGAHIDVVFSPQPSASSHNARVASWIRGAQHTVDVAMYSYSDSGIADALADAVRRGVQVRFLFDTANADRKLTDPAALASSSSGKLEAAGIDVRWVNKILHDKFVIIDGPRDDVARAATAKLATGSANWSYGGASIYDENTMFVEHSPELAAAYQHEFDQMWEASTDLVAGAPPQAASTAHITTADVPDEAGLTGLFTSANFHLVGAAGVTWTVDKSKTAVADAWVAAIARATTSIHIASGHMRSRPVAEALIARKQADPSLDIEVYLDQQEWISASGDASQRAHVDACLATATTPSAERNCQYNDFLFSKALVDAGIDVRFKTYAYRWNVSYAKQMHSKYMVIDGTELISGSYNLSMHSEHESFENDLDASGPQLRPLVGAFEHNFAAIRDTGRDPDLLATLDDRVSNDATIPLVFDPMALTWQEVDDLRALIRANCAVINSTEYRENARAHYSCPR